ncbi:unnamed protein product [Durusdinium trenchii]|uniref:Mei2-like C-terminal RNA recognition motif domain-containing protein n=1 Tax=Durusdinium trenchii TaxID=1381693 RepID=A0ABP0PLK7_9DINO
MEPWRLGSAAASASGASSIASMASIASVDSALGTHYREPIDSSHLAEDSSNLSWCSAQLAPELADSARKAWAVELGEIRELERESQGEFGDPLDLEAFVLSESRSSPTELLPFGLLDSPLNSPSSRNESSELKTSKTPILECTEQKPRQEKRGLPREYHHSRVPKNVNLQEEYESHPGREITTLMTLELIAELEDLGFAGSFNFLYIPLDKGTMSNVGYAFVNFVNTDWANRCILTFQGYRFKRHRKSSGKIAAISTAHLQGLEANLAHYEKSAVNTAKLKHRRLQPKQSPKLGHETALVYMEGFRDGGFVETPQLTQLSGQQHDLELRCPESLADSPLGSLASEGSQILLSNLRTLMSLLYVDYDCTHLYPTDFERCTDKHAVVTSINHSLVQIVDRVHSGFLAEFWQAVQEAIDIIGCEVFAFRPSTSFEPTEHALMSFHYFFADLQKSRILFIGSVTKSRRSARGGPDSDSDVQLSQDSASEDSKGRSSEMGSSLQEGEFAFSDGSDDAMQP